MKNTTKLLRPALILSLGMLGTAAIAGEAAKKPAMNTYVIERELKDAEKLDFKAVATKSNGVISDMKNGVTWKHSYVVDDKIYCVYEAPNEDLIKEHAKKGGFPANKITKVESVISPATDPAYKAPAKKADTSKMKTFVIERNAPGVEKTDLKALSAKSNGVIAKDLGSQIVWDHSYVVKDKIYCVYNAPNADLVKKHAQVGGFPADSVQEMTFLMDPGTANQK